MDDWYKEIHILHMYFQIDIYGGGGIIYFINEIMFMCTPLPLRPEELSAADITEEDSNKWISVIIFNFPCNGCPTARKHVFCSQPWLPHPFTQLWSLEKYAHF